MVSKVDKLPDDMTLAEFLGLFPRPTIQQEVTNIGILAEREGWDTTGLVFTEDKRWALQRHDGVLLFLPVEFAPGGPGALRQGGTVPRLEALSPTNPPKGWLEDVMPWAAMWSVDPTIPPGTPGAGEPKLDKETYLFLAERFGILPSKKKMEGELGPLEFRSQGEAEAAAVTAGEGWVVGKTSDGFWTIVQEKQRGTAIFNTQKAAEAAAAEAGEGWTVGITSDGFWTIERGGKQRGPGIFSTKEEALAAAAETEGFTIGLTSDGFWTLVREGARKRPSVDEEIDRLILSDEEGALDRALELDRIRDQLDQRRGVSPFEAVQLIGTLARNPEEWLRWFDMLIGPLTGDIGQQLVKEAKEKVQVPVAPDGDGRPPTLPVTTPGRGAVIPGGRDPFTTGLGLMRTTPEGVSGVAGQPPPSSPLGETAQGIHGQLTDGVISGTDAVTRLAALFARANPGWSPEEARQTAAENIQALVSSLTEQGAELGSDGRLTWPQGQPGDEVPLEEALRLLKPGEGLQEGMNRLIREGKLTPGDVAAFSGQTTPAGFPPTVGQPAGVFRAETPGVVPSFGGPLPPTADEAASSELLGEEPFNPMAISQQRAAQFISETGGGLPAPQLAGDWDSRIGAAFSSPEWHRRVARLGLQSQGLPGGNLLALSSRLGNQTLFKPDGTPVGAAAKFLGITTPTQPAPPSAPISPGFAKEKLAFIQASGQPTSEISDFDELVAAAAGSEGQGQPFTQAEMRRRDLETQVRNELRHQIPLSFDLPEQQDFINAQVQSKLKQRLGTAAPGPALPPQAAAVLPVSVGTGMRTGVGFQPTGTQRQGFHELFTRGFQNEQQRRFQRGRVPVRRFG